MHKPSLTALLIGITIPLSTANRHQLERQDTFRDLNAPQGVAGDMHALPAEAVGDPAGVPAPANEPRPNWYSRIAHRLIACCYALVMP